MKQENVQADGKIAPQGQTSGLATWSLVLGVLGFFASLLTAIPGVVCGHIALKRIREANGALSGRNMAIAGLVLGYVAIALSPVIISITAITICGGQIRSLLHEGAEDLAGEEEATNGDDTQIRSLRFGSAEELAGEEEATNGDDTVDSDINDW